MNLGAEPKKLAILGVLVVIVAGVLYTNMRSSDSPVYVATYHGSPATPAPVVANNDAPLRKTEPVERRIAGPSTGEFKPRQGTIRPEDRPDPATVDPTLRLDLLAKVQAVDLPDSVRNIFQFGAAPPPSKPIALPTNVPKIDVNKPPVNSATQPSGPSQQATAPPMTFKYYGYRISKSSGRKEAFLLDGEDIIIAGENEDMKKGRYRVVRINLGSIVVEDTQFKSTQTLPIVPDAA